MYVLSLLVIHLLVPRIGKKPESLKT
jgi:hypothetical protein